MLKRINFGLCLIITSALLYTGCSMHQLKEYTTYQLHDIKCEDDNINILLEKKRFSPKISASRAILGEIPSGTRYRLISYSLLTFNKKDMLEKDNAYISILNKKNIIKDKNIEYMNRLSIIDNNRIIMPRILNHLVFLCLNSLYVKIIIISERLIKLPGKNIPLYKNKKSISTNICIISIKYINCSILIFFCIVTSHNLQTINL